MTDRILCIEDNVVNRERLKYFLNSLNYDVLEASTGREGIITAYRDLPDLIMIDANLPDIESQQVIKNLKATPALRQTPIILVTLNRDDWEIYEKVGCDGTLLRPFDKRQVEEVLHAFLNHQVTSS